ncbi:MAG: DUF2147 domain-containing protein [Salaquimonas sp.]|jgi:uncharacterized protein (DUF2147 family)|nr:DUF2147 domain-containing protein [Salaquimonas sp.]
MKSFGLGGLAAAAIIITSVGVSHADPIEGMWLTGEKALVKISKCGGEFCVDVADGKYKGKRSGTLKADGGSYSGTLKQFSTGISFNGVATVSGNVMKLIAKKFGLTVKTDTWTRQ